MPPKDKRKKSERNKPKKPSTPMGYFGSMYTKPKPSKPDPRPDRPDRHHPPVSTPKPTPTPARPEGMPPVLTHTPSAGFGGGKPSTPSVQNIIGFEAGQIDPKLAQAAGITQGIQSILPQNIPYLPGGDLSGGKPPLITTDGDGKGDGEKPEDEKKETVKYYDDELGELSERDLRLLEKKIGQKAIIRNGKIFFVDETGSTVPAFAMMDKLSGALDKITGFDPTKAFGEMGDTGKAALYNKISKMSKSEFQDFLNRKGNLDRIMSYYEGSGVSRGNIDKILKTGDVQGFANLIKGGGGEGFDKALLKEQKPQQYWNENPPRTSAEAEEAAMAGISWIEGYGTVERPEGQGGGISGLGGGVGGGAGAGDTTTDTAQATTVPDYILRQQYMPGFTPDYTGGPEQMQIAGGYWDPVTQKWIGQGPWGTQGQYQAPPVQANQGGYIAGINPILYKNQGGMVNDGGIKSFKKYGY